MLVSSEICRSLALPYAVCFNLTIYAKRKEGSARLLAAELLRYLSLQRILIITDLKEMTYFGCCNTVLANTATMNYAFVII